LRIESTSGGETSASGGEEVVGGGERGGGGGDAAGEEVRENAPLSYSESEGTDEEGDKSLCSPLEGGEEGEEEMWGRESGDLDWEDVPGRDDLEEVPGREGPGEIGVELPARKEEDSIDEEESGERDRLGVMGCKSTELESPSSTLLSGPYPLSFRLDWRGRMNFLSNLSISCSAVARCPGRTTCSSSWSEVTEKEPVTPFNPRSFLEADLSRCPGR